MCSVDIHNSQITSFTGLTCCAPVLDLMRAWQVLMIPHTMAMLPIHSRAPKRMVMNVLGSIATPNPAQCKMQIYLQQRAAQDSQHTRAHMLLVLPIAQKNGGPTLTFVPELDCLP
jgi:hypothetical protein